MKKVSTLTLTMAASLFAVAVDPATALAGSHYTQPRQAATENPMRLDGQYIRYNKATNRAEHGYPRAIRHSWPGVKAP